MLIFRLLFCVISICSLIDANRYRRYNEIDVKLVSEYDETFESKMREIVETSERFLIEDKIVDGILNIAGVLQML